MTKPKLIKQAQMSKLKCQMKLKAQMTKIWHLDFGFHLAFVRLRRIEIWIYLSLAFGFLKTGAIFR